MGGQGSSQGSLREGADIAVDAKLPEKPSLLGAQEQSKVVRLERDDAKGEGEADANFRPLPASSTADSSLADFGVEGDEDDENKPPRVENRLSDVQVEILRDAKRRWTAKHEEADRQHRAAELQELLAQTRASLHVEPTSSMPSNRYGTDARLPPFDLERHVPVLALINPFSGGMAGSDILSLARKSPYYQSTFFNIIDVVKDQRRGGLLDLFRIELCQARDQAKAMGRRPRIISGGGDGTASFTIFMIFAALRADDTRADEGLRDSGNGFIWSDEELAQSFPALAQMPLGSANDFGHALGWGDKYPGDIESSGCLGSRQSALTALQTWVEAVIDPSTSVANFDVFGFMPAEGASACDFKLCELTGRRGRDPKVVVDGKPQLLMKEAGTPVPLFCCLYFSAGLAAYMVARFQMNRRKTPLLNKLEYGRQGAGILTESVPAQLGTGLEGVQIRCGDKHYFPPHSEDGSGGEKYREVGFLNINWQAGIANGSDRAPICGRACSTREPAKFNDGKIDMYRLKLRSVVKNPGFRIQTDKHDDGMTMTFSGGRGKGIFFQWDGEARFAFSPTGEPFQLNVQKILNLPVVLGPRYDPRVTGDPHNGREAFFGFEGATPERRAAVRERIVRGIRGELNRELNASREEMIAAGLQCQEVS